jgi:hypothetical protein
MIIKGSGRIHPESGKDCAGRRTMRGPVVRTVLALALLTLVGCKAVDLDVPLSDDKTSTLDPRLIGVWDVPPKSQDETPESFFVGKKQGSQNTFEVVAVGLEKDRSVSVHRFDMFARMGKHNYLTIGDSSADPHAFGPRWLLARSEIASDRTVRIQFLKYDPFRAAVRREILAKRLKGEIKGRRRRSDWVFALPGQEEQQIVFTDSGEALLRFLDEKGDPLFEDDPFVFKKSKVGGPFDATAAPARIAPPASPALPTPPHTGPQRSPSESTLDDLAPELPQSFQVAAKLLRPGKYTVGKLEAFRSVALRMPWAYVLDRTGTLCIFRLPNEEVGKEFQPTRVMEDAGDGNDLKVFGDVLICTRCGSIEAYGLKKPDEPRHLGRFGAKEHFLSQSVIRDGKTAFLVGGRAIQTFDLTVAEKPRFLGTFATKRNGWVGCAAGPFLYVGKAFGGPPGIAVYDLSDPTHPAEAAFIPVSHAPYALFATPNHRLVVGMDSDQSWSSISSSHIVVNGNSAVFDIANPRQPRLIKEYRQSGGRTAALLNVKNDSYFACNGVIFAIKTSSLEPDSVFYPEGMTLDGLPYHGDADGRYVALAADNVVVVLRLKDQKLSRDHSGIR